MTGKRKVFFGENRDIFMEIIAVLITTGIYFFLNEKYDFNFGVIYSGLIVIFLIIIIFLAIKYFREKR